jgi:hypothetical protein
MNVLSGFIAIAATVVMAAVVFAYYEFQRARKIIRGVDENYLSWKRRA